MPELPEVESVRREAERRLLGSSFRQIDATDSRSVLSGASPTDFADALRGRRIETIGRRGKYFWWGLDDGRSVLLHLGMTGWLEYPAAGAALPRFARLVFEMDDGTRAVFTDPRRFGKIRLLPGDPEKELPVRALGVDALEDLPRAEALRILFQRRRIAIKGCLLDQKVFAGVGNWIADEVLYQAAIRPDRLCSTLTLKEVRALRGCLRRILQTAVRVGADSEKFPTTWLFHHRWGRKKDARTQRGEAIRHDTIAGRTTAWVPKRQR